MHREDSHWQHSFAAGCACQPSRGAGPAACCHVDGGLQAHQQAHGKVGRPTATHAVVNRGLLHMHASGCGAR